MTVVTALMLANFLDAGFVLVFAPVFSERVYRAETGSIQLGLMQGTFGAGALVGSILMGMVGRRLSRRWLLSGGLAIIALRWFLLAIAPPFWVLISVLALISLAAGPINPILSTIVYERTPSELRARILGTARAGMWAAMPIGVLVAGGILEVVPLEVGLVVFGVAYWVGAVGLGVRLRDREVE